MVIFLYLMIYLWLWIVPNYQPMSNTLLLQDLFQPQFPATSQANYDALTLLDNLIEEIQYTDNRDELLNKFRQIESGGWDKKTQTVEFPYGNPKAVSSAGAKGVYQFKDKNIKYDKQGNLLHSSVQTAKNRAKKLGIDKSFIDLIPDDPRQWTDDEADIMALGNLFAQRKGNVGDVDELLIEAFGGNRDKQHEAYELHHTSLSDPGTTDRLKKIIP